MSYMVFLGAYGEGCQFSAYLIVVFCIFALSATNIIWVIPKIEESRSTALKNDIKFSINLIACSKILVFFFQ